ncbi:DUF6913 domain-containing protein [Sungkyunkwania multivorans]|uniref:DUF6913 domain-containing protein n=1 Tax=Sungkyunkwania multivorans TaxID=1173618 RepID=A0ABW3CX54_9FLAO
MIFKGLKLKSAQKFIKSQLAKKADNKGLQSQQIDRVGCIVDADRFPAVEKLDLLYEALNLKSNALSVISYFEDKKQSQEFSGLSFCDNDFGWKGSVIGEDLKQFLLQPYDLLINYYDDNGKIGLQLASVHTKKSFATGFYGINESLNDIIIHSDIESYKDFILELKKYLEILNKI